ncbi:hypothetical protein CP10139811_0816 [Chlamydia ibidis]|uniref:Uncharacterized protein n=2 Tax=Chlamydia ibidis TaxID=1405396 RepID=S7J3T3_9CHLA|nr:hypothetical protein [Chlamydia ibidis]EPP34672.1 hypothetical protein CP10139811_0816 [Chlamydia ibidis]EQM63118.1 hypothetical protein H359_0135 [Chlamydia ibidis 10-1398/6]
MTLGPIGGDRDPGWRDLNNESGDSNNVDPKDVEGEADLEDRISDHVESILENIGEVEIPEPTPSENISADLTERVESHEEQGKIAKILQRIRKVVSSIWSAKHPKSVIQKSQFDSSYQKSYIEILRETEITVNSIEMLSSQESRVCFAAVRKFFRNILRRMSSYIAQRRSHSAINLCGVKPDSFEGTISLALMLRVIMKSTADISDAYEHHISENTKPFTFQRGNTKTEDFSCRMSDSDDEETKRISTYSSLSETGGAEAAHVIGMLYKIIDMNLGIDATATARGITRLVCIPCLDKLACAEHIYKLRRVDYKQDYSEIVELAKSIDALSSRGRADASVARNILNTLRQQHSDLLGEFITLWAGDRHHLVNLSVVQNIVEANLPVIMEAQQSDPEIFEKKLNALIYNFFFTFQTMRQADERTQM